MKPSTATLRKHIIIASHCSLFTTLQVFHREQPFRQYLLYRIFPSHNYNRFYSVHFAKRNAGMGPCIIAINRRRGFAIMGSGGSLVQKTWQPLQFNSNLCWNVRLNILSFLCPDIDLATSNLASYIRKH